MKYNLLIAISFFGFNINSQNVGIDVSNPQERLHVQRSVRADTLKINSIKIINSGNSGEILATNDLGKTVWKKSDFVTYNDLGFGLWNDCKYGSTLDDYYPVARSNLNVGATFGSSISIHGDFACIGIPKLSNLGYTNNGGVELYQQNLDGRWNQIALINDNDPSNFDYFGTAVAINDSFMFVGVPKKNVLNGSERGAVLVYKNNGINWLLYQTLIDSTGINFDEFGTGLSLDGDLLCVSAPLADFNSLTNIGAVVIFKYHNGLWHKLQKFTSPMANALNEMGKSIHLSQGHLAIGDRWDSQSSTHDGSVHLFHLIGNTFVYDTSLSHLTPHNNSEFGKEVHIDFPYLFVASSQTVSGKLNAGAAYVYKFSNTGWHRIQEIFDEFAEEDENFGASLSSFQNLFIIGRPGFSSDLLHWCGNVQVFQRVGETYQSRETVLNHGAIEDDFFGTSMYVDKISGKFACGLPQHGLGRGKVIFGKIK